jgi:hypothetical protein
MLYYSLFLILSGLYFLFLSSNFPNVSAFLLNTLTYATVVYAVLFYFYPHELYKVVYPGSLIALCLSALVSLFWPLLLFSLSFCVIVTFGATFSILPLLGQTIAIIAIVPISLAALLLAYFGSKHVLIITTALLGSALLLYGINDFQPLSHNLLMGLAFAWALLGVLVQYYFYKASPTEEKDDQKEDEKEDEERVTYHKLNKILAA